MVLLFSKLPCSVNKQTMTASWTILSESCAKIFRKVVVMSPSDLNKDSAKYTRLVIIYVSLETHHINVHEEINGHNSSKYCGGVRSQYPHRQAVVIWMIQSPLAMASEQQMQVIWDPVTWHLTLTNPYIAARSVLEILRSYIQVQWWLQPWVQPSFTDIMKQLYLQRTLKKGSSASPISHFLLHVLYVQVWLLNTDKGLN